MVFLKLYRVLLTEAETVYPVKKASSGYMTKYPAVVGYGYPIFKDRIPSIRPNNNSLKSFSSIKVPHSTNTVYLEFELARYPVIGNIQPDKICQIFGTALGFPSKKSGL